MSDTENSQPEENTEPAQENAQAEESNNPEPAQVDESAGGAEQVKSIIEEEQNQGYRGVKTDPTPNHAYTVAGVLAGEETPETKAGNDSE